VFSHDHFLIHYRIRYKLQVNDPCAAAVTFDRKAPTRPPPLYDSTVSAITKGQHFLTIGQIARNATALDHHHRTEADRQIDALLSPGSFAPAGAGRLERRRRTYCVNQDK
jgi:hypothetical protein